MKIGGIISSLIQIIKPKPHRAVRLSGGRVNYTETCIQNGCPGWVLCVLTAIFIIAFVVLIIGVFYLAPIRIQDQPRYCQTCQIDGDITNKMLVDISMHDNVSRQIARYSNIDLSHVPDGFFVIFQRIDPLLRDIIDSNLGDVVGIRPDISVGHRFNSYIKKYYPDEFARRKSCRHLYINADAPGAKYIPLICYPMELVAEFDRFFETVYREKYQKTYIDRLKHDKIKLIREARAARDVKRIGNLSVEKDASGQKRQN